MCQPVAWWCHIDGLVQECSNSIANALELLQSCTKPSMWCPSSWSAVVKGSLRAWWHNVHYPTNVDKMTNYTFKDILQWRNLKHKTFFLLKTCIWKYHLQNIVHFVCVQYSCHTSYGSIRTFGIRARAALSCVGGRNAGGYGCNSRALWRPLCIV